MCSIWLLLELGLQSGQRIIVVDVTAANPLTLTLVLSSAAPQMSV